VLSSFKSVLCTLPAQSAKKVFNVIIVNPGNVKHVIYLRLMRVIKAQE